MQESLFTIIKITEEIACNFNTPFQRGGRFLPSACTFKSVPAT